MLPIYVCLRLLYELLPQEREKSMLHNAEKLHLMQQSGLISDHEPQGHVVVSKSNNAVMFHGL